MTPLSQLFLHTHICFNNPVLVGPQRDIIAGHGLWPPKLGYKEVPAIVLGHLTENQKRAFILADNKLALNAGWDLDMLRLELELLAEQSFDLKLHGLTGAASRQITCV